MSDQIGKQENVILKMRMRNKSKGIE